ncbi:MAG: RagB/SusD family nutrient uptake outer membrane protein [Ferruginibacter sp.]
MRKLLIFVSISFLLAMSSCKKDYLDTKPSDAVELSELLSKANSIYAALDGAVRQQFAFGVGGSTRHDNFGQKSIDLSLDLMGNDMVVHSQGYGWFNAQYAYTEFLDSRDARPCYNAWYFYFDIIKQANVLILNADNVKDATADQKAILKGQALGLRAYAYYYLINLFQQTYKGNEDKPGVPIYTELTTIGKSRGTVEEVYTQIISDLTAAENLLVGKTRAAKQNIDVSVVRGFRARVALLMEDWATAATYANRARQGYTLITAANYPVPGTFSTLSTSEWMWGSVIPADQATIYASFFSHIDIRTGGYAALGGQKKITKELYDLIPATDVRKTVFKTPGTGNSSNPDYNQLKHQVPVSGSWAADYLYMRAAEMYLIEAEALARQSQDANARTVLESLVTTRNPSYSAAAFSGSALVDEIVLQRRIELWGEGFGLIDVKRLKAGLNRPSGPGNHGAPNFNPAVYSTPAVDSRFLMRIPQAELNNNSSMTANDQNP